MNKDQILALVRQLLTFLSGLAIAKWGLDGDMVTAIIGGITAAVSIGFDIRNNSTGETLKAAEQIKVAAK